MDSQEIASRLRKLQDDREIRDLVARYALSVDDHDFDTLASLWAPDARYQWKGASDWTVGAENVAALLKSRIEPAGPSFHVNHDHIIEFGEDPDRATGILSSSAETSNATTHSIGAIRYNDIYIRHDGSWKFQERVIGFLYMVPVSDYPGILCARDRIRLTNGTRLAAHWPEFGR